MKDTQIEDREAIIQEMLSKAPRTDIPGGLNEQPVIHRGDKELEAPMTVHEIKSSGYVFVWDTRTYDKIPILYYMLPQKLRQRREDGSYRFTTVDPKKQPRRGTIKCLLHPNSPDRGHYDELGFRVCKKSNINNQHQLKQHMIKKHPQEWRAIEDERKEKERQEDRELQRLLLGRQVNQQATKPICDICGADFGTEKALEKHKIEKHGGAK